MLGIVIFNPKIQIKNHHKRLDTNKIQRIMNFKNQNNNVTENLRITNDEGEILDLLVDTNNLFYDYSKNRVVSFIHEQDYHLVIFNAQLNDRGFTMYSISNFCEHEADIVLLRNVFDKTIHDGFNDYLMRMAKSEVEDIFYMRNTFRALFKKPKPSDDYEISYPTLPSTLTH